MTRRRISRHRKLKDDVLAVFIAEARKHAELLPYDQLEQMSGLTRGSVRVLMADLIREQRSGDGRVRRGTDFKQPERRDSEHPVY